MVHRHTKRTEVLRQSWPRQIVKLEVTVLVDNESTQVAVMYTTKM